MSILKHRKFFEWYCENPQPEEQLNLSLWLNSTGYAAMLPFALRPSDFRVTSHDYMWTKLPWTSEYLICKNWLVCCVKHVKHGVYCQLLWLKWQDLTHETVANCLQLCELTLVTALINVYFAFCVKACLYAKAYIPPPSKILKRFWKGRKYSKCQTSNGAIDNNWFNLLAVD